MSCGTIQQDSTAASGIIRHLLLTSSVSGSSCALKKLFRFLSENEKF